MGSYDRIRGLSAGSVVRIVLGILSIFLLSACQQSGADSVTYPPGWPLPESIIPSYATRGYDKLLQINSTEGEGHWAEFHHEEDPAIPGATYSVVVTMNSDWETFVADIDEKLAGEDMEMVLNSFADKSDGWDNMYAKWVNADRTKVWIMQSIDGDTCTIKYIQLIRSIM